MISVFALAKVMIDGVAISKSKSTLQNILDPHTQTGENWKCCRKELVVKLTFTSRIKWVKVSDHLFHYAQVTAVGVVIHTLPYNCCLCHAKKTHIGVAVQRVQLLVLLLTHYRTTVSVAMQRLSYNYLCGDPKLTAIGAAIQRFQLLSPR